MSDKPERQLKFYGLNDYGTFFQVKQAMEYLDKYDETKTDYTISDVIELHNAIQFVKNEVFPKDMDAKSIAAYKALVPKVNKTIAVYLKNIDASNASKLITKVPFEYHSDLLFLLTTYGVHERVPATSLLPILRDASIRVGEILENKEFVKAFDQDIRLLLIADPKNAELVMRKHLEKKERHDVYLPDSLTNDDIHSLLDSYIDDDEANPNYIKLIANTNAKAPGMSAKLKLKAKRKDKQWTEEFFRDNPGGFKYGTDVAIADEQDEPFVLSTNEEGIIRFSYGKKWLEEHMSNGQIISNFVSLFGFVHDGMVLSLPSYESAMTGIVERFMGVKGKDSYPIGIAFNLSQQRTFGQVFVYERFLQEHGNSLEKVIAWFFQDYLKTAYDADGFQYKPSSETSTYLERSRQVFTEMESVIKQFGLYVDDGEIDKELLDLTSDQIRYHDIPSLVKDKYVYAVDDNKDLAFIQYCLFSDQANLGYINDGLNANTLFELLATRNVRLDEYQSFQRPQIDRLIELGVLHVENDIVKFRSVPQITALKTLFDYEAISYYNSDKDLRTEIDSMVSSGWLIRKSSLLTDPEASYFNFQLNQSEFSDGYDLRNKYLHGSQANKDDENTHHNVYVIGLKLMMALVIKISNDFYIKNKLHPK